MPSPSWRPRAVLPLALVAFRALLQLRRCAQTTPASVGIPGSYQSEAGCAGDWDPGLPGHSAGLRRERRHLEEHLQHHAGRRLRIQGGAQRLLGRELRPACAAERPEHPARRPPPRRRASRSTTTTRPTGSPRTSAPSSRPCPAASRAKSAAAATGIPAASAPGCRTSTTRLSTASAPAPFPPARTKPRSRSTAAGT